MKMNKKSKARLGIILLLIPMILISIYLVFGAGSGGTEPYWLFSPTIQKPAYDNQDLIGIFHVISTVDLSNVTLAVRITWQNYETILEQFDMEINNDTEYETILESGNFTIGDTIDFWGRIYQFEGIFDHLYDTCDTPYYGSLCNYSDIGGDTVVIQSEEGNVTAKVEWIKRYGNEELLAYSFTRSTYDDVDNNMSFALFNEKRVEDWHFRKVDGDGNVNKTSLYSRPSGTGFSGQPMKILNLSNGGYLMVGYDNSNIEARISLIEVSHKGSVIKSKTYDVTPDGDDYFGGITKIGSYYYILTSNNRYGAKNISLMKINDNDYTAEWIKTYDRLGNNYATGIKTTQDGNLFIFFANSDIYLKKVDTNGDEIWNKNYNESITSGKGVVKSDDGYLFLGQAVQDGSKLMKVDNDGNKQWVKTYNYTQGVLNFIEDGIVSNDGGYTLFGHFYETIWDDINWFILKIKNDGETEWVDSIIDETNDLGFARQIYQDEYNNYYLYGGYCSGIEPNCIVFAKYTAGITSDAPSLSTPYIYPTVPRDDEDSYCRFTGTSNTGNDIEALIYWYKDDELALISGYYDITSGVEVTDELFSSVNYIGGEEVKCLVRIRDKGNFLTSDAKESNTVTITTENQIPYFTKEPIIYPSQAFTNTNLKCNFTISDDNVNDDLSGTVHWYRDDDFQFLHGWFDIQNGIEMTSFLDAGNTSGGEVWKCVVQAHDEYNYSESDYAERSISFGSVENPDVEIPSIYPTLFPTSDLIYTNDPLTCETSVSGSGIITATFVWYLNENFAEGIEVDVVNDLSDGNSAFSHLENITGNVYAGNNLTCKVRATNDLEGQSDVKSVSVNVLNVKPQLMEVDICICNDICIDEENTYWIIQGDGYVDEEDEQVYLGIDCQDNGTVKWSNLDYSPVVTCNMYKMGTFDQIFYISDATHGIEDYNEDSWLSHSITVGTSNCKPNDYPDCEFSCREERGNFSRGYTDWGLKKSPTTADDVIGTYESDYFDFSGCNDWGFYAFPMCPVLVMIGTGLKVLMDWMLSHFIIMIVFIILLIVIVLVFGGKKK